MATAHVKYLRLCSVTQSGTFTFNAAFSVVRVALRIQSTQLYNSGGPSDTEDPSLDNSEVLFELLSSLDIGRTRRGIQTNALHCLRRDVCASTRAHHNAFPPKLQHDGTRNYIVTPTCQHGAAGGQP
jgi:hypothetical protein